MEEVEDSNLTPKRPGDDPSPGRGGHPPTANLANGAVSSSSGPWAVEARDIWKSFGGTHALKRVSLGLEQGKCLGLVGRNGAGKSTLVSILSGIVTPERGQVYFDGRPSPSSGDPAAWHQKIATVYQHSMVVPWLTVAENVFLGRYPTKRYGAIDWALMRSETRRVMREWGFDVDERQVCAALSVEQRQVVEIARAIASGARCLVLDEPTSALERSAVARLFDRVRSLLAADVAVLYISHHLEEVFQICDSIAVLRDGELVLSAPTAEVDERLLVEAMVGTTTVGDPELVGSRGHTGGRAGRPRLQVRGLSARDPLGGSLESVDVEVGPGEILGVTGLRGSGAATLGRVVAGALAQTSGEVLVDGQTLAPGRPDRALALGISYVPEDRRAQGFVPQLGVAENATMTIARRLSGRWGVFTPAKRVAASRGLLRSLQVVTSGPDQPVGELSGGNQQKVTVARAIIVAPGVLVAVSPTRGVDVASKALLLGALSSFAESTGASVLLASEELDDLVICHRALVMLRGRIFRELGAPPFDRAQLIAATEGIDVDVQGPAA